MATFDEIKAKAERGDAQSQSDLGGRFAYGVGVTKDSGKAAKWYRKAADPGLARAQFELGLMYDYGNGVPKDRTDAAKWYRKAAEQGFALAEFSLGEMYAKGDGMPEDSTEAVRWYRKAAEQGLADAQISLGLMYENGEGVAKDSTEAIKWYRRAANQGEAYGQYDLGLMYSKGDGVSKDEIEALAWYNIAAASGSDFAAKDRDALEGRLGRERTLAAQQRSREIQKEIDIAKTRSTVSAIVDSSPSESSGSASIISARGPREGQSWSIPDLGLELVPIPAGEFTMGSPTSESGHSKDEGPQTLVTITRTFWLGKFEVTQLQWVELMGRNPSPIENTGPDEPVENVSWTDAMEFCRKVTERERQAGRLPDGYAYTLPTEAQWEYACRAGTTGSHAGDLDAMAWYDQNSGKTTHPVGKKQPNGWGLYDMHGNVWEWCRDWLGNYPGGSVTDPKGPASGSRRVLRGGSCFNSAQDCRSTYRLGTGPDNIGSILGFRLALALAH